MATFHSFEDIKAWQKSRELTRSIRAICKRENACKDYSFVDQITRSVRSVSANIAEGSEASATREFIRFLRYAKRSVGEVRSHLYDALEEGYISSAEFKELFTLCKEVGKMIAGLVNYLHQKSSKTSN